MHFTGIFLAALSFLSDTLAHPSESLDQRALCKKPHCTSYCADGTPFDCCVVYVRDPCSDHQLPEPTYTAPPLPKCTSKTDYDCLCQCTDYPAITYLCNAQYFRDPCAPLPGTSA
ncbi:hypothetical protein BGZ57DRAFT_788262 [Hyaloscypha finlandica]|nr:hypothetical protein BGZ57DRAFT_788262 [Hyaloscypha finlandica]